VGRYSCARGKVTNIGKANKFCLLVRCSSLQVQYKRGKFRQVIPVTMTDYKECMNGK